MRYRMVRVREMLSSSKGGINNFIEGFIVLIIIRRRLPHR